MSVEAVNEALGVEVGPMDHVSITVASPGRYTLLVKR